MLCLPYTGFLCFERAILLLFTNIYCLGVFHYFGQHDGFPSQIFHQFISFDYFNPAIILICYGKVWFGTKAAKIGTKISRFGTKTCSYELIFHTHIEENNIDPFFFINKKKFNKKNQRKMIFFRFLPIQCALFSVQES